MVHWLMTPRCLGGLCLDWKIRNWLLAAKGSKTVCIIHKCKVNKCWYKLNKTLVCVRGLLYPGSPRSKIRLWEAVRSQRLRKNAYPIIIIIIIIIMLILMPSFLSYPNSLISRNISSVLSQSRSRFFILRLLSLSWFLASRFLGFKKAAWYQITPCSTLAGKVTMYKRPLFTNFQFAKNVIDKQICSCLSPLLQSES